MYNFGEIVSEIYFQETYEISLHERIAALDSSGKKKNIVYIYSVPDYATFRYRCYNMCQVLNKTTEYSASFFFLDEIKSVLEIIDKVDVIVFARVYWSYDLDLLIQASFKHDIPLVYDVDDLVFDVNKTPVLANNLNIPEEELDFWFAYFARRYYAAKYCKFYITTNEFLGERIQNVFPGKETFVIQNFLNDEQISITNKVLSHKTSSSKYKYEDTFLIGYFSGTASHNHDFEMISNEVASILEENSFINLRIVGPLELNERLMKLERQGKVRCLNLLNYQELQVRIAECDLNLIPLVENEFTNCKSELKFFESGVVKTLSIASPTFVYKKSISHKENGLIAKPGEWKKNIQFALDNRFKNEDMTLNARNYALENYYGENVKNKILTTFEQILKSKN